MRSDYGENELRRVLGVDVGGGEAKGAERSLKGSSDHSLGGGGEGEGGRGAASSRPFLLFPCPGAEYLEVGHSFVERSWSAVECLVPSSLVLASGIEIGPGVVLFFLSAHHVLGVRWPCACAVCRCFLPTKLLVFVHGCCIEVCTWVCDARQIEASESCLFSKCT